MTRKYGESLADQLEVEYTHWVMEYPETAWSRLLARACKRLRLYEAALQQVASTGADVREMAKAILERGEAYDRVGQ